MMICKKCKKEIPDESVFCMFCGTDQQKKPSTRKRANGMGTITKYKDKWRAKARRYEGGRLVSKTKVCATKKEANEWLATVSWDAVKVGNPVTFAELFEEWAGFHLPSLSESKAYIYRWARKNCAEIDNVKWEDVGLRLMQECVNKAKNTYYCRRNVRDLFSQMEQYATDCGYPSHSFASRIKLPQKVEPHKEAFTEEEIKLLWDDYNAGHKFTGAILIMIYTGMRYGEITTIKPENIFLDKGYLLGGIKSVTGKEGEIILVPEIRPIVKELLIDGELPKGTAQTFRNRFYATLKRAGCNEHTVHECRHTTATILAKKGVQPAIIKEIMRHSTYEMTMQYTHIDRDDKMNAIVHSLSHGE